MVEAELFSAALGLQKPWHVSELDFSANKQVTVVSTLIKKLSKPMRHCPLPWHKHGDKFSHAGRKGSFLCLPSATNL